MIPILFESNEMEFTSNGIGRLPDAISCTATEERNEVYELQMEYPADGLHVNDIINDRIIFVKPSDTADPQPFVIYSVSKPTGGVITIDAEHISYRLNKMVVLPFAASGAVDAMAKLAQNIVGTSGFSFWTNIPTVSTYKSKTAATVRDKLGGTEGSILQSYHGEYEFDKFAVKLWQARGADNGVTLRYGKNITGLEVEINTDNVYTGVIPVWHRSDDEEVRGSLVTRHADMYAVQKTVVLDLTSEFTDKPTAAQLNAKAGQYMDDNKPWEPNINVSVEFIPLWQTDEYKHLAALERVSLCDTVHVMYEPLGVTITGKVIKTVYDALLERYTEIEIGNMQKANLSEVFNGLQMQINNAEINSADYSASVSADLQDFKETSAATTGQIAQEVAEITKVMIATLDFELEEAATSYTVEVTGSEILSASLESTSNYVVGYSYDGNNLILQFNTAIASGTIKYLYIASTEEPSEVENE